MSKTQQKFRSVWKAGAIAKKKGLSKKANPYHKKCSFHAWWHRGWADLWS